MKGLNSLIRLQRWKVDGKRREIGELEQQRAATLAQINRYERELDRERRNANDQTLAQYFGAYEKATRERLNGFAAVVDTLDGTLAKRRGELSALYRELKRYEIVSERRALAARVRREKAEQARLDEIGGQMYGQRLREATRKQASDSPIR